MIGLRCGRLKTNTLLAMYGFGNTIITVKIHFYQFQTLCSNAEFDVNSDVDIKHTLKS